MLSRSLFRLAIVLAVFSCGVASLLVHAQDSKHRGRKYKAPPPTSRLEVTILKAANGDPIENAAVIFHPMEDGQDKGNMELKSNEDGKAVIDVLPLGDTVRLQVIAKGYQTYGQDYKVDKSEMAIEVRMKRPGEQYSIYKDHPDQDQNQDGDKPKDDAKPDDKPAPHQN